MSSDTGLGRSIKNNQIVRLLKSGKYWIWVLLVAIVVASLILVQLNRQNEEKKKKAANAPKCTQAMLQRAATDFGSDNIDDLGKLTTQIQAISGYQRDPNCMFVVTTYYVDLSDAENSMNNLKKLQAIDPNGNKIHVTDLYVGKNALDTLKSRVDYLQGQTTNPQSGELRYGEIPPGGLEKQ